MTTVFRKLASACLLGALATAGTALSLIAASPAQAITTASSTSPRTVAAAVYEPAVHARLADYPRLIDGRYTWREWHRLHLLHEQHLAWLAAEREAASRYREAASRYHDPAGRHAARTTAFTVSSSMQACIIRRESGGNPYVWNATGHWGLYQFAESTWIAYGGSPAGFGSAGPAEQTQVFDNAVAASGYSNWAPYDGC